jgi:Ribbon-helix-helix protein, copG family
MMKRKSYSKMTPAELAIATKRFDDEFVADEARPLTQDEQDQWIRVKAKRGRRKVGEGFQRISVSIEPGLLKRVTALAKERRISRSQLLAQALQDELARNRNRGRS